MVHKYACLFALGTHSTVYSLGSTVVQVLQLRERISELEDDVEKEGNQVKAVFMLREVLLVAHGQVRHVCVCLAALRCRCCCYCHIRPQRRLYNV